MLEETTDELRCPRVVVFYRHSRESFVTFPLSAGSIRLLVMAVCGYSGRDRSRFYLPQAIQKAAARKLEIIDAVRDLDDLRTPPGNRLEALSGDRRGQHSIRINEQWRVCFVWQDGNANDVEIVDYH